MPCYTQQSSVVEFSEATDVNLLKAALERMEYTVSTTPQGGLIFRSKEWDQSGKFENGKMTIQSRAEVQMNIFKRAYSAEVVRAASTRFGWSVKESSPNKFEVQRRA